MKEAGSESEGFFLCALEDLKACKILYETEIYSLSVFHLQQAVEKMVKSLMLRTGLYADSEECRSQIGHATPLAFLDYYEEVLRLSPLVTKEVLGKEIDLSQFQSFLKEVRGKVLEERQFVMKLTFDEITDILARLQRRFDSLESGRENVVRAICDGRLGDENPTDEISIKVGIFFNWNIIGGSLIEMGRMTFPHESSSRYPGGLLKPSDYSKGLGIVKAFPELLKLLDMVVSKMKETFVLLDMNEQLMKK